MPSAVVGMSMAPHRWFSSVWSWQPTPLSLPSAATRCGDRVQPGVAQHVRHEAERGKYFRKRRIANAQAPGIGAERRHDGALAIAGKTPPLHRASARGHARLRMQMTGDFT